MGSGDKKQGYANYAPIGGKPGRKKAAIVETLCYSVWSSKRAVKKLLDGNIGLLYAFTTVTSESQDLANRLEGRNLFVGQFVKDDKEQKWLPVDKILKASPAETNERI
jgi:hypothetical protein